MREAEQPVGDALAEDRGLHVLRVGVEHVVVPAQAGEDDDVGLGDRPARRHVLVAHLDVLEALRLSWTHGG